tara:strand:- start:380 stop:652 length:273 start_codon:yes stop_codon:yes gene_type:complete
LEVKKNNTGRPWNLHGTFSTFEEAEVAKSAFLEENNKMQAKIRCRHSKNNFSLKTRLLAEFVEEKPKSGKSKRRNRKAPEGGKYDASSVV